MAELAGMLDTDNTRSPEGECASFENQTDIDFNAETEGAPALDDNDETRAKSRGAADGGWRGCGGASPATAIGAGR